MSWSMWAFVEKFNKETNKWESLYLYTKRGEEFKKIDLDPVGQANYPFYEFVFEKYAGMDCREFPDCLSEDVEKFFYEKDDERNFFQWGGEAKWFDYIELKLLAENNVAMMEDDNLNPIEWDEDGYPIAWPKVNVLTNLLDEVTFVLRYNNVWNVAPGEVRVIIARTR